MKRSLFIFVFTSLLSAQEFGITTSDMEFSFMESGNFETSVSLGAYIAFDEPDVFTAPGQVELDERWLRLGESRIRLNFLSGLYWNFTISSVEDVEFTSDNLGLSIVKLEPEVEITDRVSLAVTTTLLAFDFDDEVLSMGIYSRLPEVKVGVRWSIAD